MNTHDNDGVLAKLLVGMVIICIVIYCIVILAIVIAGVAAIGGMLFGGGSAIKNYILSFKENVIDSNKKAARTV